MKHIIEAFDVAAAVYVTYVVASFVDTMWHRGER